MTGYGTGTDGFSVAPSQLSNLAFHSIISRALLGGLHHHYVRV